MMIEFIVNQHEELNELMHDCQRISKSIELLVVQQYTNQQVIHDDNDIGIENCISVEESINLTHNIYSPSNESIIEENNLSPLYDSDGKNYWNEDIKVVEKEEQPIIVKSLVEKPLVLDLLVVEDFTDKFTHEGKVEGKCINVELNRLTLYITFSQRFNLVPSFTMLNHPYFLKMSPCHDTFGHVDLDVYSKRSTLPKEQAKVSCIYSPFSYYFNFSFFDYFYFIFSNPLYFKFCVLVVKPYVVLNDMFAGAYDKLLKALDSSD